jgi:hypothetical protein
VLLGLYETTNRIVADALAGSDVMPDTILLRDYSDINVAAGTRLIADKGLSGIARFVKGDAFDRDSLAMIEPKPTLGIVSGLYELFPDNALVSRSLEGLAAAIPQGGYLVCTGQPWHPQLEFIGRALTSHRQGQAWVMRALAWLLFLAPFFYLGRPGLPVRRAHELRQAIQPGTGPAYRAVRDPLVSLFTPRAALEPVAAQRVVPACCRFGPHHLSAPFQSPLAHVAFRHDAKRRRLAMRYALGGLALDIAGFLAGGVALFLLWPSLALVMVATNYAFFGAEGFRSVKKDERGFAAPARALPCRRLGKLARPDAVASGLGGDCRWSGTRAHPLAQ